MVNFTALRDVGLKRPRRPKEKAMPRVKKGEEKRLYPRIDHSLAMNVQANGYDFATSTQNVSCLGAYCHIEKYVPPFTKISVRLSLPVADHGKSKKCDVECQGVIVRSEDEPQGGFNVAIFFNRITDMQRKKIAHYIDQFLPNKSCVPHQCGV